MKKEIKLKDPNTCEHYKEVGCIKDICTCYTLVKLTPMQQFTEWYNDYCTNYGMYPNEWEVNKKIKELLHIEQKAIEDAYNLGLRTGIWKPLFNDGKDYFQQTYQK